MAEVFQIKEPHYNCSSIASHFRRIYALWDPICIAFSRKNMGLSTEQHQKLQLLLKFKSLFKLCKPGACHCRLCKNFIAWTCFIWYNIFQNSKQQRFNFTFFCQTVLKCEFRYRFYSIGIVSYRFIYSATLC